MPDCREYKLSERRDEFARIAKAERKLCDEAGPVVAALVRAIEAQDGFQITEIRITFDAGDWSRTAANCTIVRAAATADWGE